MQPYLRTGLLRGAQEVLRRGPRVDHDLMAPGLAVGCLADNWSLSRVRPSQRLRFGGRCRPQPLYRSFDILWVDFDTDAVATKSLCRNQRGSCTEEGIEHRQVGP